jgi:acyl carrier protein
MSRITGGFETMAEQEKKIYGILEDLRPECDFASSNDFINDGLLDSFDVVTLVSELEDAYNIIIDGLDIVPENFASTSAILTTVKKNGGTV